MICKHCGKENPEEAVFCCYCGKKADEPNHCPACGTVCPDDAAFCFACGTPLKERSAPDARETAEPCEKATKPKTDVIAKVRKAFDLSGGACLMTAVLFAFVFIFCMGLTATASSSYGSTAATSMLWEYFGSAYDDLATMLNSMNSYTSYFEAACYLPVVLSTVVCASSLVLVLVFTIISAVKYGKHFKNPEIKYERYAIAAILSFILGAAAFLAINSATASLTSSNNVSISYSGATLAGIILCGIFLGFYVASKIARIGKEFTKKQTISGFVCSMCAILFAVLVAAFTVSPAANIVVIDGRDSIDTALNFQAVNMLISTIYSSPADGAMPEYFDATYICSAMAQAVQLVLLVLAVVTLMKYIGGIGDNMKSRLNMSVPVFILAAVYLVFTCLTIHFGTELLDDPSVSLSIVAAPIVAVIFSALTLAASITHKAMAKNAVQE